MPDDGDTPSPSIRVHLLRALHIERDGLACTLKYQKSRLLLAWLVLHAGQRYERDWLAEWLWSEEALSAGRRKLKRSLFELRELFATTLESGRNHVCLQPGNHLWVDAQVFAERLAMLNAAGACQPGNDSLELLEWLESAAGLYGGGFLEGLQATARDACGMWLQDCRDHYRREAAHLYRRLAEGFAVHGDRLRALSYGRRLTREEPWNERAWQWLIGLLVGYGHRPEAQKVLAQCRAALAEELDAEPSSETLALLQAPQLAPAPEQRWMTVLCCRLHVPGSTDPDDWLALQAPTSRCLQLLGEAGALVRRVATDDLLAFFGYPQAMEGAAQRALLAALKCQQAVAAPVSVVCALHSGLALSLPEEDLPDIGGRLSRPALRLADLGAAGQILVTQATADLLPADQFELQAGDPVCLSGSSEPLPVWRVSGHHRPPRDIEAPVGRDDLWPFLQELWQRAASGEGVSVLVSGEAGIGKSTVLRFFCFSQAIAGVHLICNPESAATPLHPLLHWLQSLETPKDRPGHQALTALRELLAPHRPAPALAQDIHAQLLALLRSQVPPGGVICVDDAHWADPSTRELLGKLIHSPLPGRLLLIGSREALTPAWEAPGKVEHLHLQALSEPASHELIGRLSGPNRLSGPTLQQVTRLCAGVPLFIEEMTRALLASDSADGATAPLPRSLQELLTAHIDNLGQAKAVAQLASAFDGSFSPALLAEAAELPLETLMPLLLPLRQQRLLVPVDSRNLSFRHALLREAAYQSMPRSRRQAVHGRILASLLRLQPTLAVEDPARLAWHSEHAGQWRAARGHLLAAGRQAVLRSAYREALEHYRHGQELLDTTADAQEELQLRMAMGTPLAILQGNGAHACRENFERALELAEPLGDDPQLFPAYWHLWLGSSSWRSFVDSERIARQLIRMAQQADDTDLLGHGYYALGNSLYSRGHFQAATDALRQACALPLGSMKPLRFGEDARANSLSFLALSLWFCGHAGEAFRVSTQAIQRARSLDATYMLCQTLALAALLGQVSGNATYADACAREGLEIARQHGIALWQLACTVLLGWAQAARGQTQAITAMLASSAAVPQVMGGSDVFFQAIIADAAWHAGLSDHGLAAIERGLALAERHTGNYALAELQRLKGEWLSRTPATADSALPWLERALETACRQDCPPLIVRAAESLLRHRPGDRVLQELLAAARERIAG